MRAREKAEPVQRPVGCDLVDPLLSMPINSRKPSSGLAQGETQADLARSYGVGVATINRLASSVPFSEACAACGGTNEQARHPPAVRASATKDTIPSGFRPTPSCCGHRRVAMDRAGPEVERASLSRGPCSPRRTAVPSEQSDVRGFWSFRTWLSRSKNEIARAVDD
jgi:hypothetical protein